MQPAEQPAEQQAGPTAGQTDEPNLPPHAGQPAEPLVVTQPPREAYPGIWGGGLNLLMTGANEELPGEAWVQAGMNSDGSQRLVQVATPPGRLGWGEPRPDAPPGRWGEGEGPDPWAEPSSESPHADADERANHDDHADADERADHDAPADASERADSDDDSDEDIPTSESVRASTGARNLRELRQVAIRRAGEGARVSWLADSNGHVDAWRIDFDDDATW